MVFVLKPLTQVQQTEDESDQDYKHRSRLVMCGNFAAWGEHSTTTTNLDAPLLRLMLSLATAPDTTWSSIDLTSAFLNADIHENDAILVTPPPIHCQAQHSLASQKSHFWTSRSATSLARRTRSAIARTSVPLPRQTCSPYSESHSSQFLVHRRRPTCSTLMDTTF